MKSLLQDCETAAGSVVLFIDEIHIMGKHDVHCYLRSSSFCASAGTYSAAEGTLAFESQTSRVILTLLV